jgi:hypothetical protein
MRFSAIVLTSLATMAFATPAPSYNAPVCARDVAETDLIAQSIQFAVESADCTIFSCAKVIATGACILKSIPDLKKTLACVKGKKEKTRYKVNSAR